LPHADFEIRPTTPWNYGLIVDRRRPEDSVSFEERPIGARPFSPDGAGIVGTARAQRIPAWKLVQGWAGELSPADIAWSDRAGRSDGADGCGHGCHVRSGQRRTRHVSLRPAEAGTL